MSAPGSAPKLGRPTLADVEWGDVRSDADGVLIVEGRVDGDDVVLHRYRDPDARAAVEAVALLDAHGELPADVLAYDRDRIMFAVPDPFGV